MTWQELPLDRIYFDSVIGVPGTTWPIGTPSVPSDVIADVITICAARNLFNINVHGALTLGAIMEHYCFFGNCHMSIVDVLTLNGQDVDSSRFDCLVITGAQGGTGYATYIESILYAVTGLRGLASGCALHTSIAIAVGGATDNADFINCHSIQGTVTVTIGAPDRVSFKNFIGSMILTVQTAGAVLLTGYKGDLEIDEMTGGTLDIYANGADITINADCTGGTINIWGNARVTGAGGGVVINNFTLDNDLATLDTDTDPLVMGRAQIAATTINLNQDAGSYDLFTGTTQAVILEGLNIKMPTGAAGGALTSISIQTDDATPGVIISAVDGAVANLTSEADLGWIGTLSITVATKIRLTIAGGATGAAYVCNVTAKYRAVVSGGYLA